MPPTQRLKLLIAYDGAPFRGWQSQATGDAVQDHIETAFRKILGHPIRIHGAGRTDAGVHALGQVAHAEVPRDALSIFRWPLALNANLPDAVRVLRVSNAPARFHAQWNAKGKIYTYRIWNGHSLHPLEIGRAWHVPGEIDLPTLKRGAALLEGSHDFANFAANRRQGEEDTRRTLHRITLVRRGPLLTLRFSGNGFLYHMVRLLTGSLIRCAQGRAPTQWLADLVHRKTSEKTRYLAPAHGLYLTRVLY